MAETSPSPHDSSHPSWRKWIRPALVGLLIVIFNIVVYLLPINYEALGNYTYLGAFLLTLIANATVVIPVPYIPILARMAAQSEIVELVVVAGAVGSAIGESVAFFVGRSGQHVVEDTRFYRWVQRQLQHPWRAFLALLALAAPPNPAFDVAGLSAGALGLPFWIFFTAVFLGRLIRFGLIALAGIGLG